MERPADPPEHSEAASQAEQLTARDAIRRYRCLTAHLIAESLGYFTPQAAARAIAAHRNGEAFACEWYADIAMRQNQPLWDAGTLQQVNQRVIESAYRRRQQHRGYMADYDAAKQLVQAGIDDHNSTGGMLASWF